MTVVQPNSIAGINSISVQSGQSLSIHKSDGTLIREIVASTGISTFSSISVGSATTTNSAAKSINIGLGASIAQHDANTLSFGTNGDERARIISTGLVGINNDSPATVLDIKSTKNSDGLTVTKASNVAAFLGHNGSGDEGLLHLKDGGTTTIQIYGETGQASFFNAGKIGIGTAAPAQTIHLSAASGDVYNRVDTNVNGGMLIYVQGTQRSIFANDSAFSGTITDTGIGAKGNLIFRTGTSSYDERLRITSTGDVCIGGHSTNYAASPVEVRGTNAGGDVAIRVTNNSTTAGTQAGIIFTTTTADYTTAGIAYERGGTADALRFYVGQSAGGGGFTNATERLRISSSGLVGINTTAPTALLSFGVQRSVQTYPPICFQAAHASGIADAAISTTDDSGGVDIMMGANVYMGQNGTFTRYFSSYGSAAVRCGYTGNTMFYNKSGNNAPAEAMRINGSGNVKLGGHSTDRDLGGLSVQRLHIEGTDGGSSSMSLVNNQNSTGSAAIYMSKSRGTSLNSNTVLQQNDPMGGLVFCGSDGTDMISQGAQIAAHVDGTPGNNDMPGRLTFSTTADGAVTVTDRVRIASGGFMGPLPRTGTWQGTIVYKQQSQGANYEHKIRGPLSGLLDTEMDSNFVAYIKVQTIGTGTNDAYCYYSLSQDGENLGATLTHLGGNNGSSSNKPYMVLDGQHACWKTAHATQYNFVVRVEITGGNEEDTYTATGSYAAN